MRNSRAAILGLLVLVMVPGLVFAAEPDKDPFYTKGVPLDGPPIHDVIEQIDPFSGNMKIIQTDLELPQNGGLELKIMRTYDSAIYGRHDNMSAYIVDVDERSPLGIGWKLHMGIVKNPFATSGNPVYEAPDGSQHVLYRDTSGSGTHISKDYWKYKQVSSGSNETAWELTAPDGTIHSLRWPLSSGYYTINNIAVAQVTKIENASRTASIQIEYDVDGSASYSFMKKITDSVGRAINFVYFKDYTQRNFQLKSINMNGITYANYDYYNKYLNFRGMNWLTKVTPPVGNSWEYEYEMVDAFYGKKGQLIWRKYPTGGVVSYGYEDIPFYTGRLGGSSVKFRVVKTKATSGRDIPQGTWTYSYETHYRAYPYQPNITTIDGPNGIKEVYTYNAWGNCDNGQVWKVGLPEKKETFLNNGLIQTETWSWASGPTISYDVLKNADWNSPTTSTMDDRIYIPLLMAQNITRDGKTYATAYTYDPYVPGAPLPFDPNDPDYYFANPVTITEAGDKTRITNISYWYDLDRHIVKNHPQIVTVHGDFQGTFTTNYSYYGALLDPLKVGLLKQVNKYGIITQYDYNTNGNLLKITDANNRIWTYGWNNGRINSIANPIYTVSRTINANGTIASQTDGRGTGYATTYLYDNNLRLVKVTPPVGNPTDFVYSADSSSRERTRGSYYLFEYYDGFGRPTGTLDIKGVTTDIDYKAYGSKNFTDSSVGDKVVYDVFERIDYLTHKDSTTIDYSYTGSNVTVTDEANNTTIMTHNAFGAPDEKLLVAVKDSLNNLASYNYNILGSLTSISFGGVNRTFGYSSKNFLTAETNPETGTITYGRDNVGNPTSKTDATGTTNYGYDDINRLISVSKGGSSVNFGYDKADNRTSAVSPLANLSFFYDPASRMTQKTVVISGTTYTTTFGYDANDNLTSITYPSNRVVTYSYNSNNEVTAVPGYVTSASYNLAGQPLSYAYANGITNTFTYNTRYLPTGIAAGSLLSLTYGYDTRGNTNAITNVLNSSKNQTLSYDELNRLTGFNGAWGNGSFTYDASGNRLTKMVGGIGTTFGYSSNRLASASGGESGSYAYDGAGRVTSGVWGGESYSLTYDNFNNVAAFLSGATVLAENGYDGDGLRVTKAAGGRTTVYHYDQEGNVLSENYTNGKWIADYVYINGKLLAKAAAVMDYDSDGMPDSWEETYGFDSNSAANAAWDPDGDGLNNLLEYQKGTNPTVADTDGDGWFDGVDVFPLNPSEWLDTDGDGIGNNSDPDDDNDGMPDVWESTYGLNPLYAGDAALDADGDGLTNLREYQLGTNPSVADPDSDGDGILDVLDAFPLNANEWLDADGDGIGNNADPDDDNDGMPDSWEATYGLNPLYAGDAGQDPDGDGWTNLQEYQQGSNPLVADRDNDGIPDGWENSHGLNPNDATDAGLDYDGDGLTNLTEYHFNTDPWNPDSDFDGISDGAEFFGMLVPVIDLILK